MAITKIETFRVSRVQGRSENWFQLRMIKSHMDALNLLGQTGTYQGVKLSIEDFLNVYVATPKETFKVELLEENRDEYTDKLLIIKATT